MGILAKEVLLNTKVRAFKKRRTVQLLVLTLFAILLSVVQNTLNQNYTTAIILSITFFVISGLFYYIKKDKVLFASNCLLIILIISMTQIIAIGSGLKDVGYLAYCGILIYGGMLGTKRFYTLLLASVLLLTICLGLANVFNWLEFKVQHKPWVILIDTFIVIMVIGFSIWLLINDLSNLFGKLERENIRVKKSEEKIKYLAHHDPLTNLPNRLSTLERFKQTQNLSNQQHQSLCVLFLDLDNFKTINDSMGHTAGDDLLKSVSQRLLAIIPEKGTVCRQAGDEFILILGELESPDCATKVALKILDSIGKPHLINDSEHVITCSLGIAYASEADEEFNALIHKADIAMYKAKDAGRNAYRFYTEGMNSDVAEHLNIISDMRIALQEGHFQLYYQPQFDLNSLKVIAAEALLRWKHPVQGFISPDTFIPLAEKSGLIVDIGKWVIEESCRQAKIWCSGKEENFIIAANLSSVQFKRGNLEDIVQKALKENNLNPKNLELELTESLLISDSPQLQNILSNFSSHGIHLSLDDFGTGYSNLAYLHKFNVETLKIDQSFVKGMLKHPQDENLVKAIINLAQSLGLRTLAEGIEDQQSLEKLQEFGCECGQGWLWAPALPSQKFETFMEDLGTPLKAETV
jgi:diguanylate cyclase (GGDEF)-like protein